MLMIRFFTILSFFSLSTFYLFSQNPSVSAEDYSIRQIHLDFHTSKYLQNIGKDFDKVSWQEALKEANVQSINIFAKGHHGYS